MSDIAIVPTPILPEESNSYMTVLTGTHIFYSILYISTENEELRNKYIEVGNAHNIKLAESETPDSGFDLYVPSDEIFDKHYDTKFIDMRIKTKMVYFQVNTIPPVNTGFYIHPRSSMSKTELMLANHTGVIDSGYRGNLIGAFRWLPVNENSSYTVTKDTRLVQVCHPTLCPVFVMVVRDIPENTVRGSNGFGSTGI